MEALSLTGIRKSYGSLEVIKGVDLAIAPGEFTVFVGPSGCGKSTLLRMIAGLEDISAGDLTIGGERMNDVDPSRRGIAMVFQSYALYPHLTVRQNMGFALRFAGVAKPEIERQVMEAARILELEPLLDRKPGQLSGGQRQRVAIGRAIVRHPKVFLFDEPLSNLDAELRVHMRFEIAKLHKKLGTTMIYVTHDQVEAMTLADKIVVMRAGIVEQAGTPRELYADPDNQFVAGFIGSPRMNFLAAEVVASEGVPALRVEGVEQFLPLPVLGTSLAPGMQLTAGLRPEAFLADGDTQMQLTVEMVEYLGGETLIHGRAGPDGDIITAKAADEYRKTGEEKAHLTFNAADLLFFDGTGKRIR